MQTKEKNIGKAMQMVLSGIKEALSEPEVTDRVVQNLVKTIKEERCCPLHLTESTDIATCPFVSLSVECFRQQGYELESVTEEHIGLLRLLKNPYLEGFIRISQTVTSTLEYREVMNKIVKEATNIFKAKGCMLLLLDREHSRLDRMAVYGLSEKYLEKGPLNSEMTIKDTLNGTAVQIYDTQNDKRIQYPEHAAAEEIGSILAVPVKIRDRIIGSMRVYTHEKRHFHESEIEYAMAVAGQCGIAIENALMYQKAQEKYESLVEEAHNWMEYCSYTPE